MDLKLREYFSDDNAIIKTGDYVLDELGNKLTLIEWFNPTPGSDKYALINSKFNIVTELITIDKNIQSQRQCH